LWQEFVDHVVDVKSLPDLFYWYLIDYFKLFDLLRAVECLLALPGSLRVAQISPLDVKQFVDLTVQIESVDVFYIKVAISMTRKGVFLLRLSQPFEAKVPRIQ
jgi:hypothetical protein